MVEVWSQDTADQKYDKAMVLPNIPNSILLWMAAQVSCANKYSYL